MTVAESISRSPLVDGVGGDLPHRRLAERLVFEDRAEDAGILGVDERLTCHVHRAWIHHCVASPIHVNPVTRHRWCRQCEKELTVLVDEPAGTVTISCPRCGDGRSVATEFLVAACHASLIAARVHPDASLGARRHTQSESSQQTDQPIG